MKNNLVHKPKVVILSRSFASASDEPLALMRDRGIEIALVRNNSPEDTNFVARAIGDADAVIVGSDVINAQVLDQCPNLKLISKHGVGLDAIDLAAARERGIQVTITAGANSEAVADLTLMLMLALKRNLRRNMIRVVSPDWQNSISSYDLYGASVGLIGFGKIGAAVARRLAGFDCDILVYDPYIDADCIATPKTSVADMDTLLRQCDVVSLHLPLNEKTAHCIDKDALAKMRSDAILINTARGGLLDYRALYDALKNGRLYGAGLDVFPNEPPVDEPLLALENVVATPHIATHTIRSNFLMGMMAAQNVVDAFKEN